MQRSFIRRSLLLVMVAVATVVPSFGLSGGAAHAADLPVGSLSLVPADAVFYSASLRGREQYDLVVESNAWRKLKNMPAVQMGLMLMQFQMADPQSPLSRAKAMLDEPENQELVALLADMVGEEVFVYGSAEYLDLIDLFQTLNASNQYAPIIAAISGKSGQEASNAQKEMLVANLLENLDTLVVPDTVLGFKTSKQDEAQAQLERLEKIATALLETQEKLAGSLTRKQVGDVEYLSLVLSGEMLPWEEFDPEDLDIDEEARDKIMAHVKAMTLEVNIGVHGDYLLISFGDNTDHLEALGSGDTLAGIEEMEKLAEHADERLTSVGYVSEEFMARVASTKEDLAALNEVAEEVLAESELDEDLQQRIKDDVAELVEDLTPYVPEPGAIASVGFLTDDGTESYTYNWASNPMGDASKPLSLLEHVGGEPLIACVGRGKYDPDGYALLVKWLKKGHQYFEDFALPQMEAEERDKYHAVWPQIVPFLQRLDAITGKKFLPSLADGQAGFVLDSKISSYQWLKSLPATATEMPLLEPAIICGVSDRSLLLEAVGEYRKLINDFLDKLEDISGGEAQTDFRLEAPEKRDFEFGSVYYYRLPEQAGADRRLAPNAGLSDSVMTLTLSPRTSVRLLESHPLKSSGPLADAAERPALSACYVDVVALIDALSPWIDLGIRIGAAQFSGKQNLPQVAQNEGDDAEPEAGTVGDPNDDTPAVRQIIGQVHSVLDVIKVYQSYQSLTYLEDEIQVTHGKWTMQDTE